MDARLTEKRKNLSCSRLEIQTACRDGWKNAKSMRILAELAWVKLLAARRIEWTAESRKEASKRIKTHRKTHERTRVCSPLAGIQPEKHAVGVARRCGVARLVTRGKRIRAVTAWRGGGTFNGYLLLFIIWIIDLAVISTILCLLNYVLVCNQWQPINWSTMKKKIHTIEVLEILPKKREWRGEWACDIPLRGEEASLYSLNFVS